MKYFRFRYYILVGGSAIIAAFLLFTDTSGGGMTATLAAQLATPVIAVFFAHIARKALFDYLDMETIYDKARQTATGAAIVFASICLLLFALLGLFGNQVKAQDVSTYIPQQAYTYLPIVRDEQKTHWVSHPFPFILQDK